MKRSAKEALEHALSWQEANKRFGQRIRHYREKKHLTQADVGDQVGVYWGTVSEWENGRNGLRITISRLLKLAEVLGTDGPTLLRGIKVVRSV